MKISKENAANAISRSMNCLEYETQLKLYDALMHYLIIGKDESKNFSQEERGLLTLMINLVDCANANEE